MLHSEEIYVKCKNCYTPMVGVKDYTHRTKCEDCGGNETQYYKNNPNPNAFPK